jgi:hypothetical protein
LYKKHDHVIKDYKFIRSHAKRSELKEFDFDNLTKFIFFRDPKKRIISLYYYFKIHGNPPFAMDMTLLRFLQSRSSIKKNEQELMNYYHYVYNNYLTYLVDRDIKEGDETEQDIKEALDYVRTFDFIGFQEDLDNDFNLLCDFYRIPRPVITVKENTMEESARIYKRNMEKNSL